MQSKEAVIDRLEKFKKDNPQDWVYKTKNEGLISLYQTTIKELSWVLEENKEGENIG